MHLQKCYLCTICFLPFVPPSPSPSSSSFFLAHLHKNKHTISLLHSCTLTITCNAQHTHAHVVLKLRFARTHTHFDFHANCKSISNKNGNRWISEHLCWNLLSKQISTHNSIGSGALVIGTFLWKLLHQIKHTFIVNNNFTLMLCQRQRECVWEKNIPITRKNVHRKIIRNFQSPLNSPNELKRSSFSIFFCCENQRRRRKWQQQQPYKPYTVTLKISATWFALTSKMKNQQQQRRQLKRWTNEQKQKI